MGKLILIVDDEVEILELLREVLEHHDYSVLSAEDGVAALALLETHMPALILSDLRMPRLDGIELYQKVRDNEDKCHIPFIFMSATPEKLLSLPVQAVLHKPFLLNVLMYEVKRALQPLN